MLKLSSVALETFYSVLKLSATNSFVDKNINEVRNILQTSSNIQTNAENKR